MRIPGTLDRYLLFTKQEPRLRVTTAQPGCHKAAMTATGEGLPQVCGTGPACWYPGLSTHEPWPDKSTAVEEV